MIISALCQDRSDQIWFVACSQKNALSYLVIRTDPVIKIAARPGKACLQEHVHQQAQVPEVYDGISLLSTQA